MGVILYFAVCNLVVWGVDSFIETSSSTTSWQYYNSWPLIYNISNPLCLVFRFNSFLLFIDVFVNKARNKPLTNN